MQSTFPTILQILHFLTVWFMPWLKPSLIFAVFPGVETRRSLQKGKNNSRKARTILVRCVFSGLRVPQVSGD
jgi:hypothetical protein